MEFWKTSSTLVKVLLIVAAIAVVGLLIALIVNMSDSGDSGTAPETPEVVVPTFTPTGEAVQLPSGATVTAQTVVNVRLGPSTEFPEIGALQAGQTAPVIGISDDGAWYAIVFVSTAGDQGWVAAETVIAANVENVPVIVAPPLPAPDATPTPTPEAVLPAAPVAVIEAPSEGQATKPIVFSAQQSTGSTPLVQYGWAFGDGTVADAVSVEKTYDAPGVYLVNLTVVDSDGQESVAQHQITIGAAPIAPPEEGGQPIEVPDSFIAITVDGASVSPAIVGGIPSFDAGVGQTIVLDASPALELYPTIQVVWDMGDGSAPTAGISVQHQYVAADAYQIVIGATVGEESVNKLWQVVVTE